MKLHSDWPHGILNVLRASTTLDDCRSLYHFVATMHVEKVRAIADGVTALLTPTYSCNMLSDNFDILSAYGFCIVD
jgi:hypothetical protein